MERKPVFVMLIAAIMLAVSLLGATAHADGNIPEPNLIMRK